MTDITGGHQVTITGADGAHSFNVMDGEDYILTQQDKEDIAAEVDVPVQDVQINGTSVVTDGVANIVKATAAQVKAGSENGKMLVPSIQDASAFFGLAKAAGDTTQSASDNAVGAYTDAAKAAIRQMLGIPNFEWELITDITVSEDTDEFIVTTDASGQPFELSKMLIRVFFPSAEDRGYTSRFMTARALLMRKSGSSNGEGCPTLSYQTNYTATVMEFIAELFGGIHYSSGRAGSSFSSTGSVSAISSVADSYSHYIGFRLLQYSSTSSPLILEGTRIQIYGIRI